MFSTIFTVYPPKLFHLSLNSRQKSRSVAAARPDDHVLVLLVQHRPRVVEVEDGDGVEVDGRAARVGQRLLVVAVAVVRGVLLDEADQGLHDGVVGGVHVVLEGKGAQALAPESRVVGRCHYPVLKVVARLNIFNQKKCLSF